MKPEAQHTPTPWMASHCDIFAATNGVADELVASTHEMFRLSGNEVANAAYIVECVNAHASLTQRVAELEEQLEAQAGTRHYADLAKEWNASQVASFAEFREWVKQHGALGSHDGDFDYLSLLAGAYDEYVRAREPKEESR